MPPRALRTVRGPVGESMKARMREPSAPGARAAIVRALAARAGGGRRGAGAAGAAGAAAAEERSDEGSEAVPLADVPRTLVLCWSAVRTAGQA